VSRSILLCRKNTLGKPKISLENIVVSETLQIPGIREWRRPAENRKEFWRFLSERQDPKGSVLQLMEWME
jgi:hypothetical protein